MRPVLADVHLDFSNIGWDAAVAIGTGVLALSTGALAAYTARLAKKTSDMAEDERDAAKARTRPVLMPPSEVRAVISRINSDAEPIALRLALVNAGVGPALNAYAYAVVATSAGSVQTRLATIGSVAPDHSADIVIPDVPDHDAGDFDDNAYLAVYVTVVYGDLGDRTYHSVIGLLDPDRGLALQPRPGFISGPRTLEVLATEVGEGDAPPPQWRVTFTGPDVTDDQRNQLASANVVLFASTAGGTAPAPVPGEPLRVPTPSVFRWSAYAQGAADDDAIARVGKALADDRFVAYSATLWVRGRLTTASLE
ncbi:MAG: hypothetical protein JWQ18_2994 [Conexibacter sp.]|nr:hypothetical protein [Conexibacter sp.]